MMKGIGGGVEKEWVVVEGLLFKLEIFYHHRKTGW